MRKPKRSVQLEDIISNKILGNDPEVLALVIKIHLALEAILIEMILTVTSDEKKVPWQFPSKTDLLVQNNLISSSDKSAFDKFNDFRNDLAHIFGYIVSMTEVLALARYLESCGVDFSDSIGQYSEDKADEYYDGVLGVLTAVGWSVLFHAAFCLAEAGGRNIFEHR